MNKYKIPPDNDAAFKSLLNYGNYNNVTIVNAKNPYDGQPGFDQQYTPDRVMGQSYLGTAVYTDLTLKAGFSYTDVNGQQVTLKNDRHRTGTSNNTSYGKNTPDDSAFYMNLETVIMTVSQPIKVIKTEIQGRPGTVKEYIGAGDAQVTINAIITGENGGPAQNGVYPRHEVNRLKAWLDAPVSKGVIAWWLQNMGIHNIVVENYSFAQTQGGYSYQAVSISAVSDAPVQFRITMPPANSGS